MTSKQLIRPAHVNEKNPTVDTQSVEDAVERAAAKRAEKLRVEYARLLGKAIRGNLTTKQADRLVELVDALGTSVAHFRQQITELREAIAARETIINYHNGGDAAKLHELTEERRARHHELRTHRQKLERELAIIDHEKDGYLRRSEAAKRAEHLLRQSRSAPGWAEVCEAAGLPELLDDVETLKQKAEASE